jgi:outer membrane receptor protein involved in Fe transport
MMQSKQLKAWALATTLLSGAGLSAPAFAQDADEADTTDRVVVTGSRLQTNPNLVAASPVLSVSGEEADIRGNIRIEDFVNILPQVFAGQASEVSNGASGTANLNLRGLGANRTLVLIDGRRLPYGSSQTSAPNLDIIPTQLVERVDILTGGASAVYGSDAVAGVANFILVDDFEGLEIHAQTSISNSPNGNDLWDNVLRAGGQPVPGEVWDGAEYSLSMTLGANSDDGRGNATIFASYENREAMSQADRSVSGCALGQSTGATSFGGFGCVGSGNFRAFGGDGGFGFQQENGTIVPFVGGPAQTYNFGPLNYFQRPSERFSIYGRAHYDVTDNLRAFADISFVQNLSNAQIAETASFG